MDDLLNKIKKYMEDIGNRKLINNLFMILMITIVLLLLLNKATSYNQKDKSTVIKEGNEEYTNIVESDYSIFLENKLVKILSQLNGVGDVHVMITLEDSLEKFLQ